MRKKKVTQFDHAFLRKDGKVNKTVKGYWKSIERPAVKNN